MLGPGVCTYTSMYFGCEVLVLRDEWLGWRWCFHWLRIRKSGSILFVYKYFVLLYRMYRLAFHGGTVMMNFYFRTYEQNQKYQ